MLSVLSAQRSLQTSNIHMAFRSDQEHVLLQRKGFMAEQLHTLDIRNRDVFSSVTNQAFLTGNLMDYSGFGDRHENKEWDVAQGILLAIQCIFYHLQLRSLFHMLKCKIIMALRC